MCKSTPNTEYVTQVNDCNVDTSVFTVGRDFWTLLYKWTQTICILLCLASHATVLFSFIQIVACSNSFSLSVLCGSHRILFWPSLNLFILLLTDIMVVSTSWLLQTELLWTFLHMSAYLKHLIELQCLISSLENSNSMVIKMAEVQGVHTSNSSKWYKNIFQRHCNNQSPNEWDSCIQNLMSFIISHAILGSPSPQVVTDNKSQGAFEHSCLVRILIAILCLLPYIGL